MSAVPNIQTANERPVRVLMVARDLDLGGIERDISKFARHLGTYGVEPHVACFNPGGMRWREIEGAGIPLVTIPVKSFRSKSAIEGARIFRQYVVENAIQVVHAFDVTADIFCVPLARIFGIPVLSSQLCYRELYAPFIRITMAVIDRMATGVFVNCQGIADHLHADWGLSRRRIHVCYNGYETHEFHPRARKRPSIIRDANIVFGTVAALRPEKNIKLLVESFARVIQIDHRARLLIVGSGPERLELVRTAAVLGLTDACVFQDAVSTPAEWMRAIDVFVLPSMSEGFSNSLLEAMACGCCPVASRVGGTPELVNDGESGILFEPGSLNELSDALVYLMQHPDKRRYLAARATTFVQEHLTIQKAGARLAGIYSTILSNQTRQESGLRAVHGGN
jgi:glycosyltransferase involved in cell wall biosynthesis